MTTPHDTQRSERAGAPSVKYEYCNYYGFTDSVRIELRDGKLEAEAWVVWRRFKRGVKENPYHCDLRHCCDRDANGNLWGYTGSHRAQVRKRMIEFAKEWFADGQRLHRERTRFLRRLGREALRHYRRRLNDTAKLARKAERAYAKGRP